MGKTKVFGTANDVDVPKVEFDLAKIVQNAKARGLKWTKYVNYRYKNGRPLEDYNRDKVVFACARGASFLEEDTYDIDINAAANDNPKDLEFNDILEDSQALGIGYRLAMRK